MNIELVEVLDACEKQDADFCNWYGTWMCVNMETECDTKLLPGPPDPCALNCLKESSGDDRESRLEILLACLYDECVF